MRLASLVVVLILVVAPALALEPVGELVPVDYVRTIDGNAIVVTDTDAEEVHVRLLAVRAPEIEDGTAEAFASAAWVVDQLSSADALYLELDTDYAEDQLKRTLAWVWYRVPVQTGGTVLELLNLRLVEEGYGVLYEGRTSKRYVTELAAAAGKYAFAQTGGVPCAIAAGVDVDPDDPRTWVSITPVTSEWWGYYGEFYFDVENVTSEPLDEVVVGIDFKDADGKVGASFIGSRRNLAPGQKKRVAVSVSWDVIKDLPKWVY